MGGTKEPHVAPEPQVADPWSIAVNVPASSAVLYSLTGGLREHDPLELREVQDLQVVPRHPSIRHHVVGRLR